MSETKPRGPVLPNIEDSGGKTRKKINYLCKRWGGSYPLKISAVVRRAIDEAYAREIEAENASRANGG